MTEQLTTMLQSNANIFVNENNIYKWKITIISFINDYYVIKIQQSNDDKLIEIEVELKQSIYVVTVKLFYKTRELIRILVKTFHINAVFKDNKSHLITELCIDNRKLILSLNGKLALIGTVIKDSHSSCKLSIVGNCENTVGLNLLESHAIADDDEDLLDLLSDITY